MVTFLRIGMGACSDSGSGTVVLKPPIVRQTMCFCFLTNITEPISASNHRFHNAFS